MTKHVFNADNHPDYLPSERGGRKRRGTNNGANKLTEAAVCDIKRNAKLYVNVTAYANKYGVRSETIRAILHGELWSWLKCKKGA